MALDEIPSHKAEMYAAIARQEDDDRAERLAELLERDELESVDAEEARWSYRFRLWAKEREPVHYRERVGIDDRLLGP